ncbi:MAG: hypothetical protein E7480_07560 [Ruminococcaceae bacterium]|nr:hypothetical protein [Oscillospiraceae bacterium]
MSILKKSISVILCITLLLSTLTVPAFAQEEERDVHYSDLFFGYSYYLENSNLLDQYYEGVSGTFDKIFIDFYNSGEYSWSYGKELIDTAASPAQICKNICDGLGFTDYTYNNMLDSANRIFAQHLVSGFKGSEFMENNNKYAKYLSTLLGVIEEIEKLGLELNPDSTESEKTAQLLEGALAKLNDARLLSKLNLSEVEITNDMLMEKLGDLVGATEYIASFIDAITIYSASLALENVRIEIVEDIYTAAPSGSMLRDGMSRLYSELKSKFSNYFIYNYFVQGVFYDLAEKLAMKSVPTPNGTLTLALAVMEVVSFVTFDILRPQTVNIDDLLTQVALKAYVEDLYKAVKNQSYVFSSRFKLSEVSKYLNLLKGLTCAVDAATDASEKIVLDTNRDSLATLKRNFYQKDVCASILNQAVAAVKSAPADELIKYTYGTLSVNNSNKYDYVFYLRGSSDNIEPDTFYVTFDGYDGDLSLAEGARVTVPENETLKINGSLILNGDWNGGPSFANHGDLTLNGSVSASSRNAGVSVANYNIMRVSGSLHAGYRCSFYNSPEATLYLGGNLSWGSNGSSVTLNKSTIYIGGDITSAWHNGREAVGTLVLTGTQQQTFNYIDFDKLIIENSSADGASFTTITVKELFNHNGNSFTTTGTCTFPDYDGDGTKDNKDTAPLVGLPCTISVNTSDSSHGTVSTDKIETAGGATHTVTANSNFKYEFVHWKNSAGTVVSQNKEYTFVAKKDETLTAVFKKRAHSITVNALGGTIYVPSSAEIDSVVNVSLIEDNGYVYKADSLCVNGTKIENSSFIMPDEPVTVSAEFVRNENYFALKEMIEKVQGYTYEDYSAQSFDDLRNAIFDAQEALKNDISVQTVNEHIAALQAAEQKLTQKFIVDLKIVYYADLYLDVPELIYDFALSVIYDNGTSEAAPYYTVSDFDASVLGEQLVTFSYGGVSKAETVVVFKRNITCSTVDELPSYAFSKGESYEPEVSLTYEHYNEKLVKDRDYTVTYIDNDKIGMATAVVTGIGKYEGTLELLFTIYCDHSVGYSIDGFCLTCGGYEPAALNSDNFYEIENAGQLLFFADMVCSGYWEINALLKNDIDISDYPNAVIDYYAGIFDGNGHKITVNLSGGSNTALFPHTLSCTIKNLTIAGSISTTGQFSGGIISMINERAAVNIENCIVSASINSSVSGDGTHGGLVGIVMDNATVSFDNCAFVGSLGSTKTHSCGGFVGWAADKAKVNIKNSYVAASFTVGTSNSNTFVRRNSATVSVVNCYYLNALGGYYSAKQLTAEQFANGKAVMYLNANNQKPYWTQKIGTDYPSICLHQQYENGFCTACGGWEAPYYNSSLYYEIENAGQLFWFANTVNSGTNTINAILKADIDLAGCLWTPIGIYVDDYRVSYKGVFDGNYHVIRNMTVFETGLKEAGFFGRADFSTIKNLGFENASVTQANENGIRAGIIGGEIWRSIVINCYAHGAVSTLNPTDCGGIAGEAADGTTFTNCYTSFKTIVGDGTGVLTNCFDTSNTTPEQFASGEICASLNNNTNIYSQTIGLDLYPSFSAGAYSGDITGDKEINILDLIALQNSLLSSETDYTADTNNDCKIDICDLLWLKKYILSLHN